jgi:hypothetical protein
MTQSESFYTNLLIPYFKGVKQFHLKSGKYVDILSKNLAIEVDFTHKWAESIGQSLVYAFESGKRPCIVFIFDYSKDVKLLTGILPVLKRLCITVYTIDVFTREIKLRLE